MKNSAGGRLISVVIPVFNESECIANTVQVVRRVLESANFEYEILIVDDGSTDATLELAQEISQESAGVRVLSLNLNRGHMKALEAGLRASTGDFIVSIDADLQDNPNEIPEMHRLLSQVDAFGNRLFDVAQSVRGNRDTDAKWKKMTASIYYKVIGKMAGNGVLQQAADFRMLTREALDIVNQIPESDKVYRLLLPTLGFRVITLETKRDSRYAGKSKYTLRKMITLAIDSLINFSRRPLRLILKFGFYSMLLMILFCIYSIYEWSQGKTIPGWTSLTIIVLISNSLVLISLGVIGEYVGRIFEQSKGRPGVIWTEYKFEGRIDETK